MRVDLYTFVHKAQRFHMCRLSEEMGTTDFSRATDADGMGKQVLEMMEHLKDHARNECKYIHPLFQKVGSVGAHFDKEHEHLEREIKKIESIVAEKRWENLYAVYARFLGVYLLHLDEEEAAQRDVLWKHIEDAELAETFNRFKAERPPELAKADFEFMLPALSIPELTQMFRGMKASVPAAVFNWACETATKVLSPTKWEKIANAMG